MVDSAGLCPYKSVHMSKPKTDFSIQLFIFNKTGQENPKQGKEEQIPVGLFVLQKTFSSQDDVIVRVGFKQQTQTSGWSQMRPNSTLKVEQSQ